jgi:hypothetical protein
MERERVEAAVSNGGAAESKPANSSPSRRAYRAASAVAILVGLGLSGAAGCGAAVDSGDQSEPEERGEPLEEAAGALSANTVCVDIKRTGTLQASDTNLSKEKANTAFGGSSFALSGAGSGGPTEPFYALFKFGTTTIPAGATIVSATVTLNQPTPI